MDKNSLTQLDEGRTIDKTDLNIMGILVSDSRLSYRQIAAKLGISAATVMKRIRRLENEDIILGYSARIDYEKLGYEFQIIADIRISHGKPRQVLEKIAKHPNVFLVCDKTGDFDAVVSARFRNRRSMDEFLKKIQAIEFVERINTSLILNTFKEEPLMV